MKKITALLLAIAMVLSLAACGGGGAATTPAPSESTPAESNQPAETAGTEAVEPITLRIGYMPNYASLWGVLSAMNKGYFEEEGITVDLWEFADGPSEVAAMEGGSIDLAYIGKGAHTLCIQGRAVIFAPSSVHTTDKIVVSADSGVETIEDLAGKRIAYSSGSSSESTLNSALTQAGLTMDDVELFDMDVSYMVSAMVSGSVDVAVAWNPYTTEILNRWRVPRRSYSPTAPSTCPAGSACPPMPRRTATCCCASLGPFTRAWTTAPTPTTGRRSPSGAPTRLRPAWRPTWPRPATLSGSTSPP